MTESSEKIPETPEKERGVSESSDTEHDPQFSPIITLPEVQISTNEENEIEFLKMRAKLYRFDVHNDPPEWKERGTGDLKILRHKENSSFRIVMRRDKTLKVCANHFITPVMELQKNAGSEKAFVYTVLADFADEQPKSECLGVKFGNIDNANTFKAKFEEAQEILKTDCDLYNGKVDEKIERELEKILGTNETEDNELYNGKGEEIERELEKVLGTNETEDEENDIEEEVTKKLSELDVKNGKDLENETKNDNTAE